MHYSRGDESSQHDSPSSNWPAHAQRAVLSTRPDFITTTTSVSAERSRSSTPAGFVQGDGAADRRPLREMSAERRLVAERPTGNRYVTHHLARSAAALERTAVSCSHSITRAAELIIECFKRGNKLLICGNGGSAAESQHMAAELTHRLSAAVIRRALPAISLTTDTSFLTACSNDDGFEKVFARQTEAIGQPGDVLLGVSTSGNSKNVLAAFRQAKLQGIRLIALSGEVGEMPAMADEAICIPADDTQSIQEAHLAIVHILCALVEQPFVVRDGAL